MIVISSDETDEFLANEHVEFSEEQLDFFKRVKKIYRDAGDKSMLDYKNCLCQLIEDLGGEVTIPKEALIEHHVLHYFEDDDEIIIISETICPCCGHKR